MTFRSWLWTGILPVMVCGQLSAEQKIALYGKRPEGTASANALRVLEETLRREGLPVRWIESPQKRDGEETLLSFDRTPGVAAESFSVRKSEQGGRQAISVAAGDERGMTYGIFELLGRIEAAGRPLDPFHAVSEIARAPQVRVRSLAMFLHNRDLERDWFFSKEFWNSYFQLLATSRFNQFTLTFGHQTPYFAPLFPFLLDVPGYERFKTPAYTDEERRKNLATLRMITELANQWGIRFVLGIWQEYASVYGRSLVDGLAYKDLVDYCPKALSILLRECPRIEGLQLRMNHESGIMEEDQKEFFTGMAKAIRSAGRPISVDFRAKGLTPETIASSQSFGLRPIVSTKYWREHMGLPYHETVIDPADRRRGDHRYGYWDLLPHDRTYDVSYQFWTFGSQKLLLWGNLNYARQFAESTHLGGAIGYEVFAPLSQRGFGNWPGGSWRIFADRKMEYFRWEFERYWAFYMTLGLAGYSAEGPQPILDGEFQKRFGAASAPVRKAYEAASWVLPFLTSVRAPSASSFSYWPEMDTDGLTDRYIALDTGDDNLFYRIDDYVKDYLGKKYSARMTPENIASRLDGWTAEIRSALERAEAALPATSDRKEFTSTKIDFGALAQLAEYHAERFRSAQDYEFFVRTGERQCLLDAIGHYRKAVDHWDALGRLTDGVYYDHMVFNKPPEQVGHWKDELPFLKVDLARLEEIDRVFVENSEHPKNAENWKIENRQSKMSLQWKEQNGVIIRWADTTLKPAAAEDFPDRYAMRNPRLVIKDLFNDFRYSKILHQPIRYVDAGAPSTVHASLLGGREGVQMKLYYRTGGQGFHFDSVAMAEQGKNIYTASLPAAKLGETLYYYIGAVDEAHSYHGSEKEPHAVIVRAAAAPKPAILHTDVVKAHPGTDVRIRATVKTPLKSAAVRLYYRHLDQGEDWNIVEMKNNHGAEYEAAIPGEFIVPTWDIMYAIEALDISGTGSFYPDFNGRQPFVVATVSPR